MQLELQLQLHYTSLHYTTLPYTTLNNYSFNSNYNFDFSYNFNYATATTPTATTTTATTTTTTTTALQLPLHYGYTTLNPAVVGKVTTATIPKSTAPTTFGPMSGFALPSMIHNNQPLL